ncbi:MAG: glutamine amidotransferase [Gemmatales bacterium]|nr:glutamine amidotransferase [Gemmatales bacterium]MDW8385987.1 glutamine amidotransferase [Gemmatales bacterium]
MNLWRWLLGVDAPSNAYPVGFEVAFRGAISVGYAVLLLALLAISAVGIVWLYRHERTRISRFRRGVLAGFRIALVGLLILLLFHPVFTVHFRGKRPRQVVLLLDNSSSMRQEDQRINPADRMRAAIALGIVPPDRPLTDDPSMADVPSNLPNNPSRADLVRAVLGNDRIKLLGRLEKIGPLRPFLFGQRLHSTGDDVLGRYTADEGQTALADALREILDRSGDEPPTAIVVFTDGRDNASRLRLDEAAAACAQADVPLHIYGVGCSEVGNIQLKDVAIPETIFYDDTLPIPIRWRVRGLHGGKAVLSARLGDLQTRKEIELKEGEDFRDVLTLTPPKRDRDEERQELVVSIEFAGAETLTEDNVLRKPVRLVDRKVKVLYVENTPRWEYKFLMTGLLRDRRVEARFLLLQGNPDALNSGSPYVPQFPATRQELFAYDLLILGDVPTNDVKLPHGLSAERLAWIRDFVAEGGGLVVIAGRQHAPASFADTPLAELLPVEFERSRPTDAPDRRTEPFSPLLTRFGERSELMNLADDPQENARIWRELPGFHWSYPVPKLRPGAIPLLVHPRFQTVDGQPMPILAQQNYGKGTVLFLGTDETWRWRYNARDRYFGRFWGQVIYQLGLGHLLGGPKRVQLSLDRAEPTLGRPGYVYARVLDADYKPLVGEPLPGRLVRVDAETDGRGDIPLTFDPVPGQPGEYRALLPNDVVGRFAVRLDGPEPATLEYRVTYPPRHELEVAGMAEEALRRAALLSNGRFYREEDLHQMPEAIPPRQTTFLQRHDVLPWNPLMLVILIGLATAEWIGRKWADLS